MIDETERAKIEREARESAALIHRIEKLEADMKDIEGIKTWGFRSLGAGIIYMLVQAWEFLGSLPR
jgi:hypothetical protein